MIFCGKSFFSTDLFRRTLNSGSVVSATERPPYNRNVWTSCCSLFEIILNVRCDARISIMTVGYVRPDVADMVLRVFDRSVHPELIETLCETTIPVGPNQAALKISQYGHALEFRTKHRIVTEVATSKFSPLPSGGRMVDRRLIGYRTHMFEGVGVRYHCSYQLETLPADVYLQVHREMEMDARKAILTASLPGSSSSSPDCLSYLMSDLLPEGLVIHSFHTFPDNGAVLRIQTLFEVL